MSIKRILSTLLIVMLLVSVMTACGKTEPAATAPQASGTSAPVKPAEKPVEPVKLKWFTSDPSEHPMSQAMLSAAEEIGKRSGGSIEVVVYADSVLGTEDEAIAMARKGDLALVTSGPSILASWYNAVQVASLPYAFENVKQGHAFFDSAYGQEVYNDIILKASGIRTLTFWYFGTRHLTINDIEVHKPEDLNSIVIRCMDTPVSKICLSALGANPVAINFTELYLSLQTGVAKGQENPIPTILANKFYEVQDYLVLTGHSVHMNTVHMSEAIWKTLTEEQQKIILDVITEWRAVNDNAILKGEEEGLTELKSLGMKVIQPDVEAFKKYSADIVSKSFKDDSEWMRAIEELKKVKASMN